MTGARMKALLKLSKAWTCRVMSSGSGLSPAVVTEGASGKAQGQRRGSKKWASAVQTVNRSNCQPGSVQSFSRRAARQSDAVAAQCVSPDRQPGAVSQTVNRSVSQSVSQSDDVDECVGRQSGQSVSDPVRRQSVGEHVESWRVRSPSASKAERASVGGQSSLTRQ